MRDSERVSESSKGHFRGISGIIQGSFQNSFIRLRRFQKSPPLLFWLGFLGLSVEFKRHF